MNSRFIFKLIEMAMAVEKEWQEYTDSHPCDLSDPVYNYRIKEYNRKMDSLMVKIGYYIYRERINLKEMMLNYENRN